MKIPVDVFYSVIDDANKAKQKHQEELRQYEAELQKFWQQYQQEWKAKGIHPEFAARLPGVANVLAAINQALAPTAGMLSPERMATFAQPAEPQAPITPFREVTQAPMGYVPRSAMPDLGAIAPPVTPIVPESVAGKAAARVVESILQQMPWGRDVDVTETGKPGLDVATGLVGGTIGQIAQLMAAQKLATLFAGALVSEQARKALPPLATALATSALGRTMKWGAHKVADPESVTGKDLAREIAFGAGAGAAGQLASGALRHAFPGIHPLIEAPITGAAAGAAGAVAGYPFSDKKGLDYLKEMGNTILAQAILQTVWTAGSPQTWKPRQNFGKSMASARKYYDDIFEALEGNNQRAANIAYREFQKSMDNALHYAHQAGATPDPAAWRAKAEDVILQGFKMRGWTPDIEAPTPEPATGPAAIPAPKPELPSPVAPQAPAAPVAEPTAPAVQPVMPEPVVKPPAPPDAITAPEKAAPIQSPSPAPISEPEPMPASPEKVPDVSPQATKTVTIKAPVNRLTANAADLAADYKARGIERQAAYSQFVRDRQLKPEMDAKAFFKIFDSVSPALLQEETQTVVFKPTHIDTLTNTPVMASISPDGASWNIIWENGMTGSHPVDPTYGAGFDDRFKPIEAETQPETSEPTAPKPTTTETPLETIETPQAEEVAGLPTRAETGKQVVAEYEGAQVVNNFDEKRVQIFFDGKPSKEIRDAMKKAAWKWSPSAGAWQRKNTPNAIASANMILSKHLGAPAKPAESHAAPTAEVQHEPEVPASEPAREPLPPVEPATTGKRVTVKTERGTAVDVEYAIIEADSLISSHNTALRKDPRFPEELQPRERARTASEAQITRIANMLEPEFLGESPKASEGAPIIGPDGVVESGNARVIALKRVYEEGKPGAAKYKAWLAANADRFGLDRATLENMESPVLVRIRKTDLDREQFVREANEAAVAAMSATEQAMADAKRMSGSLMTLFRPSEDGEINTVANRDFIRVFMDKVVGPTERGRYMTADGTLSQEGIARIRNAVFARAYGDPTAMAKLAESPDNNVRNVTGAMLIVAPRLADIKERIEAGHLFDLDITEDIAAAMKKLSELREQGMSVKEYLMQMTMFEEELSPFAKELLATFEKYRRSRKKITELLHAYADAVIAAGDPKQQVLFGERTPPTKKEVLEAAIRAMEVRYGERDIQGSLFGGEASGIRREAIAETGAGEVGGRRESAEGHVTAGGEAKSLAEAEQELRLKVDDVIDEVIPPVGTSVTIVGKSKGKDAEVKTKLTFTDPEIEARWQAAKGIRGPSATEKLKDFLVSLYHKATREFELLPRGAEFAKIQFALRKLQKQRDVASDRTLRILQGLTVELNEPQFDLFTRAVILADLQHSADKQEALPFGFTQESLAKEKKRIDDAVSKDPAVLEAIRNRRKVWDALKRDYIESMEEIGFNVEDWLKREDYFRHQVLMYAQLKSISGTGKKLRTPTGRGFLKKREGSELDINTDYLQAEYEVMAQMIYDIEVAKTIKVVDDEHNIVDKLKAQATEANTQAIMRELEKSAKLLQGNVSAATLYRKLNQKQAIGISKLAELAANGELPVGPNGEWEDVVDALAVNHEENALARQAMKEFGRKPDDPEYAWAYLPDEIMPRLLKYASWILKQKEEGSSAAATLFKGIQEKRKYIQETLGEEYLTWRDLIPEGYTIWQPREGSVFYMSNSIPAQLAEALTTGLLEKVGITKEDLKHVVVLGGPRREFVIKEELASTLDNLIPPRSNNVIDQIAKSITNKLKVWYLLSPQRWFKYNIRNLSGDAEAPFLGNPSTFKKVPQAWRELYQVYFGDRAMTPDMQAWFERGGMQSTLQVQEMGDINQLKMFKRLHDAKGTAKEIPLKVWQGYWKAARLSTDFRESILRYAAFLDYLEQMRADPKGRPENYGASMPEEVDALDDIYDKAFMLSNDLLGAYDRVSVLGKNIRERLALFWSYEEMNFKRYIQLWKNIGRDPRAAEKAGRAVLGQAVKKTSPFLIMAAGKFILKALAFWGAMTAYNYIFHRDSERELPPDVQARPHMVFGRDKNGKLRYFPRLGLLEDFLKWFGLDEAPLLVKDFLNGRQSLGDIARHIARAPVNEMVQQLMPLIKTPIEMLTERKLYPDAFSPGRIRDPWLYIAQSLGIEPEYRALGKGPKLPYSERLEGLLTYKVDPGEAAYWYVIDEKNRWLDKQGKRFIGVADSAKSLALYNLKLALRYNDKKAVQKYMAEYYAAGGTYEGMNTSLKAMHPLSGLSKEDESRFIEWLYKDPDGKERLERAIDHYYDLLGRM